MEISKRTVYLLHKQVRQELDAQEWAELQAWAGRHPAFQQLLDEVSDEQGLSFALRAFDQVYEGDSVASVARMRQRIAKAVSYGKPTQKIRSLSLVRSILTRSRKWLPYAAAALIAVTMAALIFYSNRTKPTPTIVNLKTDDVAPGRNRAVLTLVDGRTIDLKEGQIGIRAGDGITYLDGSVVLGQGEEESTQKFESPLGREKGSLDIGHYMLSTPQGGTYQLTLADGSNVWLNAASTLKYPSRFSDSERVVELEGEGYFEITKDAKRPFKVRSSGQEIEVLGTAFNVSAYPEENATKTTLVEGSIRLLVAHEPNRASPIPDKQRELSPGEQAVVADSKIDVKTVNTDLYTAWKDGFFYFDRLPTHSALMQLARWYDLELIYEGKATINMFAYIERDKPLSAVLNSLEKSGLKFKVTQLGEQRQLIVLGEN